MNKKFGALKDNLGKIQRHLEEQSNNNEIVFENKLKAIKQSYTVLNDLPLALNNRSETLDLKNAKVVEWLTVKWQLWEAVLALSQKQNRFHTHVQRLVGTSG